MTKNKKAFITTRLGLVVALAALAAVPATALAGDHHGKAKSKAAKECKAERGTTDATREAFAKKYGTKGSNYKNTFGKCVSHHAKKHLKAVDGPKGKETHPSHKRECAPGKARP